MPAVSRTRWRSVCGCWAWDGASNAADSARRTTRRWNIGGSWRGVAQTKCPRRRYARMRRLPERELTKPVVRPKKRAFRRTPFLIQPAGLLRRTALLGNRLLAAVLGGAARVARVAASLGSLVGAGLGHAAAAFCHIGLVTSGRLDLPCRPCSLPGFGALGGLALTLGVDLGGLGLRECGGGEQAGHHDCENFAHYRFLCGNGLKTPPGQQKVRQQRGL
ncbi:hypothetical protein APY03_4041 [Variovorax sp. WDL1]|nr:hypothetical protein APY03_4041 [Variovorax sp. WDL1]